MSYTPPPSNETDFNFSGALAYTPSVGSGVNFTFEVQVVVQYTTFDGLDDGMSTGAITLGADMDCFVAVRRTSATGILLYTTAGSGVYLGALDATAGAASAGAGTPTYAVNGVDVAGGTGTTRTQLAAAIPIGSWVVLEIRNANLSAWATLAMGAYTGFPMGMDFAQTIVCPAGDAAARQKNRQWLGNKVGLVLP